MASKFVKGLRGVGWGLALPAIFFGVLYFPRLRHFGDHEPWVENLHDAFFKNLNVHSGSTRLLHVRGKVFPLLDSQSYLELPALKAIVVIEQGGMTGGRHPLLVDKISGEEVRFETRGIRLEFLGEVTVESCSADGFLLSNGPHEFEFNLRNRTQFGRKKM
ncbi:hypothetical protein [Luteolibacter sp. LG18]|uniref:hypothetical protein n=1 Tax=Luteolibacter sp. LG18 TaxID=2819286 RepID=UPI002B319AC9|nr:hypothetical protein llg_39290 [Luteolibacter sp. LG18]